MTYLKIILPIIVDEIEQLTGYRAIVFFESEGIVRKGSRVSEETKMEMSGAMPNKD